MKTIEEITEEITALIQRRKEQGINLMRGAYSHKDGYIEERCLLGMFREDRNEQINDVKRRVAEYFGITLRDLALLEAGFEGWRSGERKDGVEVNDQPFYILGDYFYNRFAVTSALQ